MAISPTVLAANISGADATSYTTASVDTSAHYNQLITVAVYSVWAGTGLPNVPTLTTARGLNIATIASRGITGDFAQVTLFRTCIASGGSSGTLVIDFAGQTQTMCAWEVIAWTGTRATAANNGSDGIGVSNGLASGSNGVSATATLAALQTGSSTYYVSFHQANENSTQSAGYAELTDVKTATAPTGNFESAWLLAGSTAIGSSWTTNTHPRITEGCEILQAFAASGGVAVAAASESATADEAFKASTATTAAAAALAGTATEAFKAGGGLTTTAASLSATDREGFEATASVAAAAAGYAATGSERFFLTGGVAAAAASFAGEGAEVFTAVGAFGAAPAEIAGTAGQGIFGGADLTAAPAVLGATGRVFGAIIFPSGGGGAPPKPRGRPVEELKPFPPPEPEPEPVPLPITAVGRITAKAPRIGAAAYNEAPPHLLAYAATRPRGPSLAGEGSQDLRPAVEVLTRQLEEAVLLALLS